jgi:hypothetical protein
MATLRPRKVTNRRQESGLAVNVCFWHEADQFDRSLLRRQLTLSRHAAADVTSPRSETGCGDGAAGVGTISLARLLGVR